MSGLDSTRDPLDAGLPGGPGGDIPAGSAEVHSRITHGDEPGFAGGSTLNRPLGTGLGAQAGTGTQGGGASTGGEQNLAERGMERAREMADQAGDRIREVADEAGDRAREVGERASEAASRARHRAAEALDQAEDVIEERTGLISTIRQNPLPALGIAFGLGFLLAGGDSGDRGRKSSGAMQRATTQAKSAIMGAISAAAAQQVRSLLSGLGGGQGGGETARGRTGGTSAGTGPARH